MLLGKWILLLSFVVLETFSTQNHECELGMDGKCINDSCKNDREKCDLWMMHGLCEVNPNFMLRNCRKACGTCDIIDETEMNILVLKKQALHEVGGDESLIETPYGITQKYDETNESEVIEVIQNTTDYMENIVFKDPSYKDVKKTCKNRNTSCARWAFLGECQKNSAYMQIHCAPSCRTCHALDPKFRCPINDTIPKALSPGDLHKTFERIIHDSYYQKYRPVILSKPNPMEEQKEQGIIDGPWVIVLENFLTFDECDRLIELGAIEGYVQSTDVGKMNFDGTYDKSVRSSRTSTNAWCNTVCYQDIVARRVEQKISNLTGIPEMNNEHLQLLRYETGQFYNMHHDYIDHQASRQMGARILTVFLYLNDIDAGGETEFPYLEFSVQPKKGRAVIWPSVMNDNPDEKDPRTNHRALPVQSGVKYAANAWIHQRDFKSVLQAGCA